jgi:hypothetical protein
LAAADAVFRYPDFFKVGISEAGNHDQPRYEVTGANGIKGLLERQASGATNYARSGKNQNIAKNPEAT